MQTTQRGLAVLTLCAALGAALWTSGAAAQSNAPVTGAMGGVDARTVAAPSAAPSVSASAAASTGQTTQTAQQTPVASTVVQPAPAAQVAPVQEAARTPTNVVRRTTPPRVGEPARDGMLGDETEALLAVQGNNLAAGRGLPMLGATASRAYKRYLDSFNYPIPAFFETMVQSTNGSGGGGGGGGGGGAAPAAMGTGVSQ
ncbi:hypothetical protein UC34_25340 [Pandoraea vervacti]|uniref:DUF3613 domain-containing protein n=1 Tax=Pandoraea vervacti TaxID=656178 RepID=A0ABM6FR71_9BURK|nr:DUF3613 domain-containing protein [Pandoraea vervacti]APD11306.1 hypothetical protein UC34_25340 [Pandoraea vervacti]